MRCVVLLTVLSHVLSEFHHYHLSDESQPTLHILDNKRISTDWSTDVPFYPMYPIRTVQVLDGNWFFGYGGSDFDLSTPIPPNQFEKLTPNITYVPSAFDVKLPGILGPRGTAFYRANVTSEQGKDIQVYIAACAFYCQLYFDGNYIGDHKAGGYQPFWYHITQNMMDTSTSNHQLFIVSDNKYNYTTAPTYTGGDFYHFGGINRNVLVHTLPIPSSNNNYLLRVAIFPNDITKLTIDVNITFWATLLKDDTVSFQLTFDGNTSSPYKYLQNVSANSQWIIIRDIAVPNAKLWSLTHPNLHTLTLNLMDDDGQVFDAIKVRFGLRWIGIDPKTTRLTLNGNITKLYGWNRHTMYPETGNALTMDELLQDIAIIKQANVNYLRGAHYPQDQRWLDLCDENGIAMWSETLGPGVSVVNLNDAYFMKYQIQAVNEMLDASINNPSVFFWAFYNEGPSDKTESMDGYNASAEAIRARDKTRYVTWADNKHDNSVTIGPIADIASFNSYPAWYSGSDVNDCYTLWNGFADKVKKLWPGKPFLISETGAGAVYEWDNATNVRWSQLYQSQVVYADAFVALNNTFVSGISLWQFSDIKANYEYQKTKKGCNFDWYPQQTIASFVNTSCNRPKCENNKGSVDYWRRFKIAYNIVQHLFSNFTE